MHKRHRGYNGRENNNKYFKTTPIFQWFWSLFFKLTCDQYIKSSGMYALHFMWIIFIQREKFIEMFTKVWVKFSNQLHFIVYSSSCVHLSKAILTSIDNRLGNGRKLRLLPRKIWPSLINPAYSRMCFLNRQNTSVQINWKLIFYSPFDLLYLPRMIQTDKNQTV